MKSYSFSLVVFLVVLGVVVPPLRVLGGTGTLRGRNTESYSIWGFFYSGYEEEDLDEDEDEEVEEQEGEELLVVAEEVNVNIVEEANNTLVEATNATSNVVRIDLKSRIGKECGSNGDIAKVRLTVKDDSSCEYQSSGDGKCGSHYHVQATKHSDGSVTGLLSGEVWRRGSHVVIAKIIITCMEYSVRDDYDAYDWSASVYVGGTIVESNFPDEIGSFGFTSMTLGTLDGPNFYNPSYVGPFWDVSTCTQAQNFAEYKDKPLPVIITPKQSQVIKGTLSIDLCEESLQLKDGGATSAE